MITNGINGCMKYFTYLSYIHYIRYKICIIGEVYQGMIEI